MMAAKPIIYAIEGGNDMVKEAGCGISIPSDNPGAIAAAALQLMNMAKSKERKWDKRQGICVNSLWLPGPGAAILENYDQWKLMQ